MKAELMLWLAVSALAAMTLLSMMRRRQLALLGLLKKYTERQAQWARRRAKADAIAAADPGTNATVSS